MYNEVMLGEAACRTECSGRPSSLLTPSGHWRGFGVRGMMSLIEDRMRILRGNEAVSWAEAWIEFVFAGLHAQERGWIEEKAGA